MIQISVATFPLLEFRNLEGMSGFLSVFPFLWRIGNQGFLLRKTFLPSWIQNWNKAFCGSFSGASRVAVRSTRASTQNQHLECLGLVAQLDGGYVDRSMLWFNDDKMINSISPVPGLQSTVLDGKMDRFMTMMVPLPLLVTRFCSFLMTWSLGVGIGGRVHRIPQGFLWGETLEGLVAPESESNAIMAVAVVAWRSFLMLSLGWDTSRALAHIHGTSWYCIWIHCTRWLRWFEIKENCFGLTM